MPEYGPSLDEFNPSWMEDGGGVSGGSERGDTLESNTSYDLNSVTDASAYDMSVWSRQNQEPPDVPNKGCTPAGSPDTSKVYVKTTSYNGTKWVCDWTETTTCS